LLLIEPAVKPGRKPGVLFGGQGAPPMPRSISKLDLVVTGLSGFAQGVNSATVS
jgi:hypothetical protein